MYVHWGKTSWEVGDGGVRKEPREGLNIFEHLWCGRICWPIHPHCLINLPHPIVRELDRGGKCSSGPQKLTWGYPCPAKLKRPTEERQRNKGPQNARAFRAQRAGTHSKEANWGCLPTPSSSSCPLDCCILAPFSWCQFPEEMRQWWGGTQEHQESGAEITLGSARAAPEIGGGGLGGRSPSPG